MKKRAVTFFILLALSLCACGKEPAPSETLAAAAPTPSAEAAVTPADTQTPAQTALPAEMQAPENTQEPADTPTPADTPEPEEASEPVHEPSAAPETPAVETPAPQETGAQEEKLPYSVKTADTVLTVKGTAAEREWYFTLAELQSLGGTVSADYFSRGKEPQEMTTSFEGISVQYLLENVVGITDYKKAAFRASDGYSVSFSKSGIGMTYINEKDESVQLKMILAWREDGGDIPLRLVMGQMAAGEYNRTNWARSVCEIEVKAG